MVPCYGDGMENVPNSVHAEVITWPKAAQDSFRHLRAVFLATAETAQIGPLDETLKWGQPAWRPRKPRTGATLRMTWMPSEPDHLVILVDCKTDLAVRMRTLYPNLGINDGQRRIALCLHRPHSEEPLRHLAAMTFCYHLDRRPKRL